MRKILTALAIAILSSASSFAQTANAPAKKPATKPPAATKSAAASSQPAAGSLPTEAEVNGFMKHQFGYDPKVTWKIVEIKPTDMPGVSKVTLSIGDQGGGTELLVMPGNKNAIVGQYDLIPFGADPFADDAHKLQSSTTGPTKGDANAKLTIVEFSDLQCPFCKQSQPVIDKLLQEVPNARLIYQNFPLETIHKWAMTGARFADCVAQQGTDPFWKFLQGVYDAQADINEANAKQRLTEIATASGAKGDVAATCAASPQSAARVAKSQALGKAMGINSTPTVFLNGRKILNVRDLPFEQLKAIAEFEKRP